MEAFIPVQAKETALLKRAGEPAAPVWMKNQYKEALAKARAENKLVFINFTGYACTNCHWMKANMFPRPEITGLLKDFVLVDLYTDGTDARFRTESATRREALRHGGYSVLCHRRSGRAHHRDLSRPDAQRVGIRRLFEEARRNQSRFAPLAPPGAFGQIQFSG